MSELPQL